MYVFFAIRSLFTEEEVSEIRNTTIKDIIIAITNITADDIQDNPFFFHPGKLTHTFTTFTITI